MKRNKTIHHTDCVVKQRKEVCVLEHPSPQFQTTGMIFEPSKNKRTNKSLRPEHAS